MSDKQTAIFFNTAMRPADNDVVIHCRHVEGEGERAHAWAIIEDGQHGGKFFAGGKMVFAKWVALCADCREKYKDDPTSGATRASIFDGRNSN